MGSQHENDRDTTGETTSQTGSVSRRELLTAGIVAGVGAVTLAAAPGAAAAGRPVADSQPGTTAAEFRARFAQTGPTGEHFTAYGYLTAADGATDEDLFAGAPLSDSTALLTAVADGELVRRTVDQSVHSLDIEGTLTVYQRSAPGASFGAPASFSDGTPVAVFDITLQDIVTVFATGQGLPTLSGDMRQTQSGKFNGVGGSRNFGHVGNRCRLFATGIGTLLNPATFNSILEMAGNWTTK
jgi:hypothetical protein